MKAYLKILLGLVLISEVNCSAVKFCFFQAWADRWPGRHVKMQIDDIDPFLCTHLVWAFSDIDEMKHTIVPYDEQADEGHHGRFKRFNDLKRQNPRLKTILAITDNVRLAVISKNYISRVGFSHNALKFVKRRSFNGLLVDWSYPSKRDKTNEQFAELMKTLREIFDADEKGSDLILSASMSSYSWTIKDAYELEAIHPNVDYFVLKTMDYHSIGSKVAGFSSPLYKRSGFNRMLHLSWTVSYYLDEGVPPSKLVIVITGVATRFVLENILEFTPGSAVTSEIRKGPLYGLEGRLAYPEVCIMLQEREAKTFWDKQQCMPYMVLGDNFVGFENVKSITKKIEWLLSKKVKGVAVWSIDLDDFRGKYCGKGRYPLLKTVNAALDRYDKGLSGGDATAKHVTLTFLTLCFLLSFNRL